MNTNVDDSHWQQPQMAKVMKGPDFGVAGDLIHLERIGLSPGPVKVKGARILDQRSRDFDMLLTQFYWRMRAVRVCADAICFGLSRALSPRLALTVALWVQGMWE